jgi:hypothetical protein
MVCLQNYPLLTLLSNIDHQWDVLLASSRPEPVMTGGLVPNVPFRHSEHSCRADPVRRLFRGRFMLGTGSLLRLLVIAQFVGVCGIAAQDALSPFSPESLCTNENTLAQIYKREEQVAASYAGSTATVRTEIHISKNPLLLVFHAELLRFSEQVDFSQLAGANRRTKSERIGNLLWNFEPSGFADRVFLDRGRVTQDYYQLKFSNLEPCQEQTCCVFEVIPARTAGRHRAGPFFLGKIWVETGEYTIIRFKGQEVPASHLHFLLTIDHWFEFDSWRVKVAPHLWIPDCVLSRNSGKNRDWFFPKFASETKFSDFKIRSPAISSYSSR